MSACAESRASFERRAKEIGLSADQCRSLADQEIKCFNNLAYAVCEQPGQVSDQKFRVLLDGAFNNPSLGLEAMLKQLCYESITIAVAAIKQRVETQPEGALKRLPPQERDERIRMQSERITGFVIQGEYEPAHSVVDFFTTMLEDLPLSKCISREQELLAQRVDKRIVVLEDQQLHVKNKAPDITADLSTDLKVQNGFVRSGISALLTSLYFLC